MKSSQLSAVVASLLAAFAFNAQAQPIPVVNFSFETLTPPQTVNGNPGLVRGVDIWEAQDGTLHGNGFQNGIGPPENGGQPTGNLNPAGWTVTEFGGSGPVDAVAYDARWPQWDNVAIAGPAHGLQAVILDNRGPGGVGQLEQNLGTLGTLGIAPGNDTLELNFQARMREPGQSIVEDPNVEFFGYFKVNGVEQTAGRFVSPMGSMAGGRLIEHWTELGNGTINTTQTATPVPVIGDGLTDQTEHMGSYTATLDLMALNAGDLITIGFRYEDNRVTGGCCTLRTYLDNVSVEALSSTGGPAPIPEPASIVIWSLIGLGLAGFGYYRIRRQR